MKLRKVGAFGAEADEISPDFRQVWDAFFASQVLVFRDQKFTPSGFFGFAKQFGKPEPHVIEQFHHPEYADILILSNVQKDGKPTGLADAGTYFHTDYSYLEIPARATTLYSIQVPSKGGDTLFADQYAAYNDLPSVMKRRIDGLVALHHYGNRDDLDTASRTVASVLTEDQENKMTWVKHKLARKHPITGRTALYSVSGSSFGVEGMPQDEALDLLDELKRHAIQEKYQLRLKYGMGDVVVWDNASLLHSATLTDPSGPAYTLAYHHQGGGEIMRGILFAALAATAMPSFAQIEMHGASQFNDDHAFNKALVSFEELVKSTPASRVNFVLHKNSELGLEKEYFEYMEQGKAVDYAIVSPAHMSTFSKAAPFIDAPFLFRDLDHWNKVLDADMLKPVADEIAQKADVMLIGYAGGGTRNIFANKPVRNMAGMKGLKVRVQGAPIWSKTFAGRRHVADRDRLQRGL